MYPVFFPLHSTFDDDGILTDFSCSVYVYLFLSFPFLRFSPLLFSEVSKGGGSARSWLLFLSLDLGPVFNPVVEGLSSILNSHDDILNDK